jgi:hypothetical protein
LHEKEAELAVLQMGITRLTSRQFSAAKRQGEVPVFLGCIVDRLSASIGFLMQAWTESFVQWSLLGSYTPPDWERPSGEGRFGQVGAVPMQLLNALEF